MPMHAERRRPWEYGPGLWGGCFGRDYGDVASVVLGEDQAVAKKLKNLRTISRS